MKQIAVARMRPEVCNHIAASGRHELPSEPNPTAEKRSRVLAARCSRRVLNAIGISSVLSGGTAYTAEVPDGNLNYSKTKKEQTHYNRPDAMSILEQHQDEPAPEITITHHAYERAKERLSWNKNALERTAYKAYASGVGLNEASGQLHRFLTSIRHRNDRKWIQIRIYADAIFLFEQRRLVTVYQLPANLRKIVHRIFKARESNSNN